MCWPVPSSRTRCWGCWPCRTSSRVATTGRGRPTGEGRSPRPAGITRERTMNIQRTLNNHRLTFDIILKELRWRHFAVLATVDAQGRPHAVGVAYGVAADGTALYVMTRRHLKKARNIAANPN